MPAFLPRIHYLPLLWTCADHWSLLVGHSCHALPLLRTHQDRFWRITRRFVDELAAGVKVGGARSEEGQPVVNAVRALDSQVCYV